MTARATKFWGKAAAILLIAAGAAIAPACSGVGSGSAASGGTGGGGTGGGGTNPSNTTTVSVNPGPANAANLMFVTVTVCVPASTTCQQIPNVLVDTGSVGLRLLASQVSVALPQASAITGSPLGECVIFADNSFAWGSVVTAQIQIAGEKASSVPIQLISPTGFPLAPDAPACNTGGVQVNTPAALGANGILGVGLFLQDCGAACVQTAPMNPGIYFSCASFNGTCAAVTVPLTAQVQNPVSQFTSDNNGVLISLPTVPAGGSATVSGSLIFGVGTQTDNALGTAKVYNTDGSGNVIVAYKGTNYPSSFVDSGSNGIFFLDSPTSGLALCTVAVGFYCPTAPTNFLTTVTGQNGTSTSVTFTISNAETLFSTPGLSAFSTLGGPLPLPSGLTGFDFGLPFFYGRPVFIAFENSNTPGGAGPYYAF